MDGSLVVLLGLIVAGVVLALILGRRKPAAPTAPSYRAPTQIDPADFVDDRLDKDGERLKPGELPRVILFGSKTCDGCHIVRDNLEELRASSGISFWYYTTEKNPYVLAKYKIDGIPTTLVVDADGVVEESFFGPVGIPELSKALDP